MEDGLEQGDAFVDVIYVHMCVFCMQILLCCDAWENRVLGGPRRSLKHLMIDVL